MSNFQKLDKVWPKKRKYVFRAYRSHFEKKIKNVVMIKSFSAIPFYPFIRKGFQIFITSNHLVFHFNIHSLPLFFIFYISFYYVIINFLIIYTILILS